MGMSAPKGRRNGQDDSDRSVDPLELFFDLVFVFAMAQVSELMLDDVSWAGFGHASLGLAAVWWAWVCYAWLSNTSSTASVPERFLTLLSIPAMLLAAIALPAAFGPDAVTFALSYLVVRLLHVVLLLLDAQGSEQLAAARRLVPHFVAGPALVVAAAYVSSPYQELLWVLAAAIDLGGPLVAGVGGFRVMPNYFVERHGLIVIIVLGEAIVRTGAGAGAGALLGEPIVLVGATLGVLICGGLWWSYFGLSPGAQARLLRTSEDERPRLARDAYSYLHLPIVGGVVFFAVGIAEALPHLTGPLPLLPAVALCGGVAVFYAADVAYRWRDHHKWAVDRIGAAFAAALVVPVAMNAPVVWSLAGLTAVGAVRAAWEFRYSPLTGST